MSQPCDESCGPTSLHAVYNYFSDAVSLQQVIDEVTFLETGGTLAVLLGIHARQRGYKTKIYTYNLKMFDPTWFREGIELIEKLRLQQKYKNKSKKFQNASNAYIQYLSLGGEIDFKDLTPGLLKKYFMQNIPILAGLSSTYLYNEARDHNNDVKGEPQGHFVVLCGYDEEKKHIVVADPYQKNPILNTNYYTVTVNRLINSIMLGVLTNDANLLIIEPIKDK
jgi:hypothetical protein